MCIWEINSESKEELRYGKSPEQVQYLEEKLQNLKSQQHTVRQPVSLLRQEEKQKRKKSIYFETITLQPEGLQCFCKTLPKHLSENQPLYMSSGPFMS